MRRVYNVPRGAIAPQRARRGKPLGDYGAQQTVSPPGFYDEETVFNQYGPEGFELLNGPLRKFSQFAFNVGPVAQQILPANARRFYLMLQNKSVVDQIFFGTSAIDAISGFALIPGAVGPPATAGGNFLSDYMCLTDEVWVFCPTAAQLGVCGEGVLLA